MARSKDAAGSLIAAKVKAAAAAAGVVSNEAITDVQTEAIWKAVADGLFVHDASSAQVAPGGFAAPSGGGPVTGQGGPIT